MLMMELDILTPKLTLGPGINRLWISPGDVDEELSPSCPCTVELPTSGSELDVVVDWPSSEPDCGVEEPSESGALVELPCSDSLVSPSLCWLEVVSL